MDCNLKKVRGGRKKKILLTYQQKRSPLLLFFKACTWRREGEEKGFDIFFSQKKKNIPKNIKQKKSKKGVFIKKGAGALPN